MKLRYAIPLIAGVGLLVASISLYVELNRRWEADKLAEAPEIGASELRYLLDEMKFDGVTVLHAEDSGKHRFLHVRLPASDVRRFRQRIIDSFLARRYRQASFRETPPEASGFSSMDKPPWWKEQPGSTYAILTAQAIMIVVATPPEGSGDVLIYHGPYSKRAGEDE